MMTKCLAVVFLLLSVDIFAEAVVDDNTGPARQRLEAFSDGLQSLEASFNQSISSADGFEQEQSEGHIWLRQPGRLRWSYAGEFPELIVADGANIWIYDEMLDQVTVRPQQSSTADSPLMLLTDLSLLDERFDVTEVGNIDDLYLLSLQPKETDSEFDRIVLGLDDTQLRLMSLEDAFGQRTEVHFGEIVRNPELDAELFEFTPPDNADVVGETADMVSN